MGKTLAFAHKGKAECLCVCNHLTGFWPGIATPDRKLRTNNLPPHRKERVSEKFAVGVKRTQDSEDVSGSSGGDGDGDELGAPRVDGKQVLQQVVAHVRLCHGRPHGPTKHGQWSGRRKVCSCYVELPAELKRKNACARQKLGSDVTNFRQNITCCRRYPDQT